jgi:fatty acid desaturase
LFWNANYHAEHHLAPGVPFHALPRLHELVGGRLAALEPSYLAAHRALRRASPG